MKKLLLILAMSAIGMISCKKEEPVKPAKAPGAQMGPGSTTILLGMD